MNWKALFLIVPGLSLLPAQSLGNYQGNHVHTDPIISSAEMGDCWTGTGSWLPGTIQTDKRPTSELSPSLTSSEQIEDGGCAYV